MTMNTKSLATHCVRHVRKYLAGSYRGGPLPGLTGWRSGEHGLRWHEVDLARRTATLGDMKTGRSVRPLSHAACDVLRSLSGLGDLVFPATRGNGDVIMSGFKKLWKRIAKLGELPPDVTPHVLRHSFASLAAT